MIRDLEDRYVTGESALESRIVETSLKYGVLSRFTAFVAVDQRVVTEGGTTRAVTQPVDLPSGWDPPMAAGPTVAAAASMPASMPTFGTARRFAAAESSATVAGDLAGGFGAAPGGGAPGWQPPTAPPPPAPSRGKSAPSPLPAGDAPSLAKFVTDELARLRANDGQDVWLRAGLLSALAERIRVQLTAWQLEPEPLRATLGTLSAELAVPTADTAEVDRRWQHAIATLDSLTARRPRRAFWKR
jgi:Ca-activated chloride channel family protein